MSGVAIMAHDDQNFSEASGVLPFASLALEVVSVINERQAKVQANQARPYIRSILDRRLTTKAYFSPSDALTELRALRLGDEAIIDNYIPEAARSIGEKWNRNELGFVEVTIASVRLQSLLAEVEFINPEIQPSYDGPLNALIVSCEGDQHTLGCFVAAAQIRRTGATVETLCAAPDAAICKKIMNGDFDAVLFSCSRSQSLESIRNIVMYSKKKLSDPPIFALGGIIVGTLGNIQGQTGVDLVTSDTDELVSYCAQRSPKLLKQASR